MRHAPARCLGEESQPLLPVEPVNLVDNAIDVIRQVGPRMLNPAIMAQHCVDISALHQLW